MTFFFQTNATGVILKKCPGSSELYNVVNGDREFEAQKVHPSIIESAPHGFGWLIKAF